MNLADLLIRLNADPTLYKRLLGINQAEYQQLEVTFLQFKDNTRKIPKEQRLLASLLIHHYSLSTTSIKTVIFSNQKTTAVMADTFKTAMQTRLEKTLKTHPDLALKIASKRAPLAVTHEQRMQLTELEHLIDVVLRATTQNALITRKALPINTMLQWTSDYLGKKVTQKKKTGQTALKQLFFCFEYDMSRFDTNEIYDICYFSSMINTNLHHASHRPMVGYGKAQIRESQHPLYYSRSQSKHPYGLLFRSMTASLEENRGGSSQCLQPKNAAAHKIIATQYDTLFTQLLARYDQNGFLKKEFSPTKQQMEYFSTRFAYSGLRQNAFTATIKGTTAAIQHGNLNSLFAKVRTLASVTDDMILPVLPLNKRKLANQISISGSILQAVDHDMQNRPYYENLQQSLNQYRREHANRITTLAKAAPFKNLRVSYDVNTFTVDVRFYPNEAIEESDNYKEGITNIIINFFIGLVNYHAAQKGLFIAAQRRQSFGFSRTTITDTLNMQMRISLGYESEGIVSSIHSALMSMENLLEEYNFLDRECHALKAGFAVAESPKGKVVTDKTGNKFRQMMRSNENMLRAVITAEYYLLKRNVASESAAFKQYIDALTSEKLLPLDTHHPQPQLTPEHHEATSAKDNIVVTGILNNVIKHSIEKMMLAKRLIKEAKATLPYSYTFISATLSKYLYKGDAILCKHTQFPASHIHAKTLLLIEDIMEMLILLDALILMHSEQNEDSVDRVALLSQTEIKHTAQVLALDPSRVEVFFTDNGQQALIMSYVCLSLQLKSHSTYIYPNCYYELPMHIQEDLKVSLSNTGKEAEVVFVDVRNLNDFMADLTFNRSLKLVILDTTHNPCLPDNNLDTIIPDLRKRGVWVVLVESMLKHEQLGLDKFQSGKITTIAPRGKRLYDNVRDELSSITQCAMSPLTATFFQMINEICRDKITAPVLSPRPNLR